MLKIAHVCTSAVSHQILLDKMALLQQAGYDVHLISSFDGIDVSAALAGGIRLHDVPMNRKIRLADDVRSIFRMYALFRRERYDLVHTHTAKAGLIGRIAARLARVPAVIHTSHGLPFYEGQPRGTYRLYRALEKVGARFCHALCSQNREDIAKLQALAPSKPVYWEGNGVHPDRLYGQLAQTDEAALTARRRQYGIPADSRVLLVGARFEPVKNHALLLDALAILKKRGELAFVTLLAGKGELEPVIRERIASLRLERDVRLIGHRPTLVPELALADAVALTSEKEGIPRIVMEAMALGKPVIATDVLGTRELVADGETGTLVPLGDAGRLADALEGVMTDETLRRRMGEAGRRRIEMGFTERHVVERLGGIYRELLPGGAPQAGKRRVLGDAWKRLFDLAVSVPALVVLSPIMGAVALLIRLTMGRGVLFKQARPGRDGRIFRIYKFRTMTDARDPQGNLLPDDQRLNGVGKWIRRTSLDELPQLLNVVKGDMSLVGPRPLLPEYLALYTPEQRRRHEVRPGITGWSQVNGRNAIDWEERFRLDVWYVDHRSFALDVRILLRTVRKVAGGDGVAEPGQATRTKYTGNAETGLPP